MQLLDLLEIVEKHHPHEQQSEFASLYNNPLLLKDCVPGSGNHYILFRSLIVPYSKLLVNARNGKYCDVVIQTQM
jgi:hypothetical protein